MEMEAGIRFGSDLTLGLGSEVGFEVSSGFRVEVRARLEVVSSLESGLALGWGSEQG